MRLSAVRWAGVGLILVVFALSPGAASLAAPRPAPSPDGERQPPYKAAILMEAETGKILEEHQADARHIPASIVKMMLMLLVAETVKKGEHKLEEIVRTSAEASRMGGSQVYLKQGETFSLEEIYKVKIRSVNTIRMQGKLKRVRFFVGRQPEWKKAIVTLQEGHKIEVT